MACSRDYSSAVSMVFAQEQEPDSLRSCEQEVEEHAMADPEPKDETPGSKKRGTRSPTETSPASKQHCPNTSSPLSDSTVPFLGPSQDSSAEALRQSSMERADAASPCREDSVGMSPCSGSSSPVGRRRSDGSGPLAACPWTPNVTSAVAQTPAMRASKGIMGSTNSLPAMQGSSPQEEESTGAGLRVRDRAAGSATQGNRSWRGGGWWRQGASMNGGRREPGSSSRKELAHQRGGDKAKWSGFSTGRSRSSMNLRVEQGGSQPVEAVPRGGFTFKDLSLRTSLSLNLLKRERVNKTPSVHGAEEETVLSPSAEASADPAELPLQREADCKSGSTDEDTAPDDLSPELSERSPAAMTATQPEEADNNNLSGRVKSSGLSKFWVSMSPVRRGRMEGIFREESARPSGNTPLATTGLIMSSPLGTRVHSFRSTLSVSSNSTSWQAWDGASSKRWEEDQVGSQSARWSTGVGEPFRFKFSSGLQEEEDLDMQEESGLALHRSQHLLDGQPQAVEGRKPELHAAEGPSKAQGFQLQPQRQRQQLQALHEHGEMIQEILSGTTPVPAPAAAPPQAHGRAWRLGKPRAGGGVPTSPLNILVAQRGAMKEHLGRFLLDASKLEVGEVVATGGSGEVRRGRYEGKNVAIKILKAEGDQSMEGARVPGRQGSLHSSAMMVRAEFRREVLALMKSSGNCKQLLPLVGVTVDIRQRLCIVTRYMPGGTLHDLLQRCRRAAALQQTGGASGEQAVDLALPLPQLLDIATDVARGMQFLHEHDIMHRDLKSGNVFLESDGRRAVVGDLGVARLKGERGEMTKEVGTYRWMAPEVFGTNAWPVTSKSDVYSFAILVWEMVTGEIPYEGYTPVQAAVAVALSGLRPTIPGHCPRNLASLIQHCWDMDPDRRPGFSEIVRHLEAMAASQRMVGEAR